MLLNAISASAQASYSCDFEDETQRNEWKMNLTANSTIARNLKNHWFMGQAGNNTTRGKYGLFISDDSINAHYVNSSNLIMAYVPIKLDANANGYMLSFDYRAVGNMTSESDGLYAFWLPEKNDDGTDFKVFCNTNNTMPAAYSDYLIQLQPDWEIDRVNGAATWKQCRCYIPKDLCDGETHLLAFGWLNGVLTPQQPAACVDNIVIMDARGCNDPTGLNVSVSGANITFSWNPTGATKYEVSAFAYTDNMWYGPYEVTDTSYVFGSIPAGTMDFYVRAQCDEDLWSMKSLINKFVYYPDEMCIDYLSLTSQNCFVDQGFGSASNTGTFDSFRPELVDYGAASSHSRHTIHYDHAETDVVTDCTDNNGVHHILKTVPDGALASIRLGNTEVAASEGGGAERCEFEFVVDSSQFPVLQLSYAVVIEAPTHTADQNSRFRMDILHKVGNSWVSLGSCVRADFNANDVYNTTLKMLVTEDSTWHMALPREGKSTNVVWKDWTTIGVNLAEYHGETLKVRFTTCDCIYNAHFGYAYFTLNCSDGNLKGMKCAVVNPEFEAPDGFVYRWLLRSDEQYRDPYTGGLPEQYIKGREQKYYAGFQDDNVYAVDCMFEGDTTCYFTLYASTLATNPIPRMDAPIVIADCKHDVYNVQFKSTSYIQEINHIRKDTTVSRMRLDSVVWDFGDGSERVYDPQPQHKFPREGGIYTITLSAHYVTCDSTISLQLVLPEIGPTYDTAVVYLCDADKVQGYLWQRTGKHYSEYGVYSDTTSSLVTGCDSVATLDLREPIRDTVKARILDNQYFHFHGGTYNKPGKYYYTSQSCDSALVLDLAIYEALRVKMDSIYYTCHGEPNMDITYTATPAGQCEFYSMMFDSPLFTNIEKTNLPSTPGIINIDVPALAEPNYYTGHATFYDSISGNVILPFKIAVRYNKDVIAQRWNDVLMVRNEQYNGGYTFSKYQWYRCDASGVRIDSIVGAEQSYYYETTGLRTDGYYCAGVTRSTDGVDLLICPVMPTVVTMYQDIPTIMQKGASFKVSGQGIAQWYDITGQCRQEAAYNEGDLYAPQTAGIYLLKLIGNQGAPNIHRIMVQ